MAFDFRSVMSGKRKDSLAVLMRTGLSIAKLPYGLGVWYRNLSFDNGRNEIHRCGVPVISVGNLTTGGTGKTPIVCFLAKWFRSKGVRVAIVSRGYGRGESGSNDEAMELHARLPDVPHVQDPDRVEAARIAVEELQTELILMDDGFQHRRLHRNLDIVVVDATEPFGFGHLLPRGLLREPLSSLRRADIVMLSRSDAVSEERTVEITQRIHHVKADIPVVRCTHAPTSLLEYPDQTRPLADIAGQNIAVVSAIGNPEAFKETLRKCGANIIDSRDLPDHDAYSPETVKGIREWCRSFVAPVSMIVCTHKDLVKLCTDQLGGVPVAALLVELKLTSDAKVLERKLKAALPTES
ncbi:Tetraacyldisaccharide 4'-kinase [Planctomycetes bacterium CA13]|uniref:Tetraacyldisaccharide 4'-kinase n=1 Tax=Novipirellula herctigrandis TaxID=2527986 RepID=A0A5C5Z8K3_9BACT|nr:Tetraacyldisaccharide 4'-kinase [Planctomycetes bacterium CA13]